MNLAGDAWRISFNNNGPNDPFGSKAIHGAIAKAMYGETYNVQAPVQLTLEQAGWFVHILGLAVTGDTLSTHNSEDDRVLMKLREREIMAQLNNIKRILIISPSDPVVGDFAISS